MKRRAVGGRGGGVGSQGQDAPTDRQRCGNRRSSSSLLHTQGARTRRTRPPETRVAMGQENKYSGRQMGTSKATPQHIPRIAVLFRGVGWVGGPGGGGISAAPPGPEWSKRGRTGHFGRNENTEAQTEILVTGRGTEGGKKRKPQVRGGGGGGHRDGVGGQGFF